MVYVMSDLHGQFEKYRQMLDRIQFCSDDTLYILGDFVDRGDGGIRILLDVMNRPNVECLIGNHDWTMASLMENRENLLAKIGKEQTIGLFQLWFSDGGKPTYDAFISLDSWTQKAVLQFIFDMHFIMEITVNGQAYFMAHTVPGFDANRPLTERPADEFIYGEPDYEIAYFPDKTVITGHTPTELIDPESKGRIWKGNRHIAIDCGAGFGENLGCLCLENMQEYYC